MGTAIKHPVPDRVRPSFVIFDIRAVCLTLKTERQSARVSKINKWPAQPDLAQDSCTRVATEGVKGLNDLCDSSAWLFICS